jgi:hypothetical protein
MKRGLTTALTAAVAATIVTVLSGGIGQAGRSR